MFTFNMKWIYILHNVLHSDTDDLINGIAYYYNACMALHEMMCHYSVWRRNRLMVVLLQRAVLYT